MVKLFMGVWMERKVERLMGKKQGKWWGRGNGTELNKDAIIRILDGSVFSDGVPRAKGQGPRE